MTTNDEWVKERANKLTASVTWDELACACADCRQARLLIAAFGLESFERGKAEQDKAVADWKEVYRQADASRDEALDRLDKAVSEAVNAERERCRYAVEEAVARERLRGHEDHLHAIKLGENKILARLDNPDEALVEAFKEAANPYWMIDDEVQWRSRVVEVLRALARTLTENSE